MKKLLLALLASLLVPSAALAQTKFTMPPPAGVSVVGVQVVTTCGTASGLANNNVAYLAMDTTGVLCTSVSGGGITAAVTVADGADVGEGATTAAAATAGSTGSVNAKLRLMTTQLATINTTLGSPFQAGGTVNQGTSPWVVSSPAPSSSASIGITPVVSASAEATHVLKASAGNAYSAYAVNYTATAGFLVLLNSTTAPADGAITPLACSVLTPNGNASINYAPGPPGVFSTGITAVITSAANCNTKTTGVITGFISGSVQ